MTYVSEAEFEIIFISTIFGAMSAKVNTIVDFFFGGSSNKGEKVYNTAIREGYEELNGLLGPISEIEKNNLKITQINKVATIIFISILLILLLIYFTFLSHKKNNKKRDALLEEIKFLKEKKVSVILDSNKFELSKKKINSYLNRGLNETDWCVLLILLDNPMVLNKDIAEKSNMSIDGIGSSLRRMYDYFEINETKYKKVALIHKAVNISERI